MKKTISIILVSIVLLSVVSFFGCSKIDNGDAYGILRQAIENSYKEGLYFIKSSKVEANGDSLNINTYVMSDTDKQGYGLKDENGNYINLKTRIVRSKYTKETNSYDNLTYMCGLSKSINKQLESVDYLFRVGEKQERQKMDINTFMNTELFKSYSIENHLREIDSWKETDINFDIENGGVNKKLNVIEMRFKLNDEYLLNYEQENGQKSVFDGKYIILEIAYDRISNVIVYMDDLTVTFLPFEYESYSLKIVYMSPKFEIYNYDEMFKDGEKKEYPRFTDAVIC